VIQLTIEAGAHTEAGNAHFAEQGVPRAMTLVQFNRSYPSTISLEELGLINRYPVLTAYCRSAFPPNASSSADRLNRRPLLRADRG
jgi:hypothetical protein